MIKGTATARALRLIFEEVNVAGVGKDGVTETFAVVVVSVVNRGAGLAVSRMPPMTAATVTNTMTAVHHGRRRVATDEA